VHITRAPRKEFDAVASKKTSNQLSSMAVPKRGNQGRLTRWVWRHFPADGDTSNDPPVGGVLIKREIEEVEAWMASESCNCLRLVDEYVAEREKV